MVRREAVAGYFYPSEAGELRSLLGHFREIVACMAYPDTKDVSGVVSPHAGYTYSGVTAACAHYLLSLLPPAETIVLLGPNHRGVGERVALSGVENWRTPLGSIPVDTESREFLLSYAQIFSVDDRAHQFEHSIEVQLPFLQYFLPYSFSILPVSLLSQDLVTSKIIGEALFALAQKKRILLVASSDFSHYEQEKIARSKDTGVIERICALDVEGFFRFIREERVSVCGPGGIAALMVYHAKRGGKKAELLNYTTSGEVTGEKHQVVGYAAISFPLSE
ncbi:AmmeMemoRadiSam system protein B [Candidatus Caldatribacterium sp.]|uniref:AmmeMemoRadiSam system protein B n=1 Tax=Candidatus Caldatribacterium sp. TaxID=2282143 RepID=UPI00299761B6|nr:AmmeMemoRadiSam system protein B [Candidatus Caldatribacterium sp.]MDW8081168.1 AmmeMemoRadiSam system protein B [Candidatus Calescibacterium sp.]